MNADIMAKWLQRQGHDVVRTASSFWVEAGPRIYQAFPYHRLIRPSETELRALLIKHAAIGLRYSTPLSSSKGVVSYHVVYTGKEYPLSALSQKARYDVRKGLKCASVEPVTFDRLAAEGWAARAETLVRQGRIGAENLPWWERLCRSAKGLPGFETWATVADGEIVASLIAFTTDNCCSILYQQSKTAHLRNGVNNALTYTFTQEVLKRAGISVIFYGLHSLDAPASVDEYKFRMHYTTRPVRQLVTFHPLVRPFFNKVSHAALSRLAHAYPDNSTLAKTEGMVRFYLEGKRSLLKQKWPDSLLEHKTRLIEKQEFIVTDMC